VDYVAKWSERTGIAAKRIVPWLGIRIISVSAHQCQWL